MAALIPISFPSVLTSAPPEFPGFIAASVCIKDVKVFLLFLSLRIFKFLAFAETIPAVTVLVRLKGLPTANTHCPTCTLSLFPYSRGVRSSVSIFITARSVEGSVPMIFAINSRLSLRVIVIESASATT